MVLHGNMLSSKLDYNPHQGPLRSLKRSEVAFLHVLILSTNEANHLQLFVECLSLWVGLFILSAKSINIQATSLLSLVQLDEPQFFHTFSKDLT